MTPNELYYFVPGQVILHIEHDDMTQKDLEDELDNFLQNPREPWSGFTRIPDSTITFEKESSELGITISMIRIKYSSDDENSLINKLGIIYDSLYIEKNIILDPPPRPLTDRISLVAITPNWLAGGSPHQPAMGGPGSWPVLAPKPPVGKINYEFSFPGIQNQSSGEGIEVAILDTAPWTESYMIKRGHEAELEKPMPGDWRDHLFLQELLGNDLQGTGNLKIISYNAWKDFCFSLEGHNYLMPDHGLFVAGIIHTIAPLATLKLYEVLNPYGAGSYESIYKGLKLALEKRDVGKKLVINMSLVLNNPSVNVNDPNNPKVINNYKGLTDIQSDIARYFYYMSLSIHKLLEKIANLSNVIVVAAAGNDWDGSTIPRPTAHYPAAYPEVIGVGALKKNSLDPAPYSNLCDQPIGQGYMTLGGESGINNGVRGVFIHDFPNSSSPDDPITNDTGWAWWAGTSFAAPIITGLLAKKWSSNIPATANTIKGFLSTVSGGITPNNEKVISAQQT